MTVKINAPPIDQLGELVEEMMTRISAILSDARRRMKPILAATFADTRTYTWGPGQARATATYAQRIDGRLVLISGPRKMTKKECKEADARTRGATLRRAAREREKAPHSWLKSSLNGSDYARRDDVFASAIYDMGAGVLEELRQIEGRYERMA